MKQQIIPISTNEEQKESKEEVKEGGETRVVDLSQPD